MKILAFVLLSAMVICTPALAQAGLKPVAIKDGPNKYYSGKKYKSEIRSLHWKPELGWNGLVPGKSTIEDAKKLLGEPVSKKNLTYNFTGHVHIGTEDGSSKIATIEIFPTNKFFPQTPIKVKDALTMYGPLKKLTGCSGSIYIKCLERKGLRIETETNEDDAKVIRLEFNDSIE